MFSKVILFLALAGGAAAAPPSAGDAILDSNSTRAVKYAWESFKSEFRREYADKKEENIRFKHFEATLKLIEERNAAERHNGGSAQHGITRFADLSQKEFQSRYLKTVMPEKFERKNLVNLKPPANTKSADWTGTYTTPVKDQGYCGSCWAFSVTEQLESDSMRQLKTDYIMAPQQLVSCDSGDYGCSGGWPTTAYDYVESAGGLVSEEDYPYTSGAAGVTGTCASDLDSMTKLITVNKYYTLASEESMASHVLSTGPVAIAVDASSWSSYTGGVLSVCGTSIDHAVQAVGVDLGQGYWKVRNSWGSSWGESGFIRLAYGEDMCGITTIPTYVDSKAA